MGVKLIGGGRDVLACWRESKASRCSPLPVSTYTLVLFARNFRHAIVEGRLDGLPIHHSVLVTHAVTVYRECIAQSDLFRIITTCNRESLVR
jgi:hypothetical protein